MYVNAKELSKSIKAVKHAAGDVYIHIISQHGSLFVLATNGRRAAFEALTVDKVEKIHWIIPERNWKSLLEYLKTEYILSLDALRPYILDATPGETEQIKKLLEHWEQRRGQNTCQAKKHLKTTLKDCRDSEEYLDSGVPTASLSPIDGWVKPTKGEPSLNIEWAYKAVYWMRGNEVRFWYGEEGAFYFETWEGSYRMIAPRIIK